MVYWSDPAARSSGLTGARGASRGPSDLLSLLTAMRTLRRFAGASLLLAAVLILASCGNASPAAPTIPEPVLTTDTFGGNLTTGGMNYHQVSTKIGKVTLTMTGISDPSIKLGMEIGLYQIFSCTAVMGNSAATIGNSLVGVNTAANELCVRVYDPGTLPTDGSTITYSITVEHY